MPLLGLWCPWRACGAPVRPVVPLIGRWCPWQACGAPGPQGGGHDPCDPPLGSATGQRYLKVGLCEVSNYQVLPATNDTQRGLHVGQDGGLRPTVPSHRGEVSYQTAAAARFVHEKGGMDVLNVDIKVLGPLKKAERLKLIELGLQLGQTLAIILREAALALRRLH